MDRIFDLVRREALVEHIVDDKASKHSGHRIEHDPQAHGRYIIDGPALDLRRIPSQTPLEATCSGSNLLLPCDPTWFEFVSRSGNTRLAAIARAKAGRDVAREASARGETMRRLLTNHPELDPRFLHTVTIDILASPTSSTQVVSPRWSTLVVLDDHDQRVGARVFLSRGEGDGSEVPADTEATMVSEVTQAVVYAMWLMGNGRADYTPVPAGGGGLGAVEITEAFVVEEAS